MCVYYCAKYTLHFFCRSYTTPKKPQIKRHISIESLHSQLFCIFKRTSKAFLMCVYFFVNPQYTVVQVILKCPKMHSIWRSRISGFFSKLFALIEFDKKARPVCIEPQTTRRTHILPSFWAWKWIIDDHLPNYYFLVLLRKLKIDKKATTKCMQCKLMTFLLHWLLCPITIGGGDAIIKVTTEKSILLDSRRFSQIYPWWPQQQPQRKVQPLQSFTAYTIMRAAKK